MERQHFSRFGLILLALLTLGWGVNWPVMKIVLQDVPPLTFRAICLIGGGVGILLLARIAGQSIVVARQHWLALATLALCNTFAWNLFAVYGVMLLPAGRAALLGYTMPIWGALLAVWLLNEKLSTRRVIALLLGMTGVGVLMSGDFARLGGAMGGVLLMLAAAISWGFGVVLLKRFALPIPTVTLTGWTMLTAGVPMTIGAIGFEHDAWRPVGAVPTFGVLYNLFVAFMFCYWAWNRIVLMVPIAVSSLSSLVTPMVGVASGMWLLNEALTWRELVAGALIVGAIALVLLAPTRRAAISEKESAAPLV